MKKSAAKTRIINHFYKMVTTKGYAKTNISDLAYKAKVSVGTLYYHFPQGKLSILQALTKQRITTFIDTMKAEGFYDDPTYKSLDEGLHAFFTTAIRIHRTERLFLAATESEFLSNLDHYLRLYQDVPRQDLYQDEIAAFIEPINILINKFPRENLNIKGQEYRILRVIDYLTHRHIYSDTGLGSDQEFTEMLITILRALAKQ